MRDHSVLRFVLFAAVGCLLLCPNLRVAQAQSYDAEKPLGATAQSRPAYLAHAGLEQRLGASLPMASTFTDETGHTGPLSDWFSGAAAGKPVVFAEIYYQCAMLCPQVVRGLETGLRDTTLTMGRDYNVLVFSIDPMDKPVNAAAQKADFLQALGPKANPSAVHFLTAAQPAIDALSAATGFHFVRVPGPDGKLTQFAHSSVIMFATPEGKLSKYLAGIDYPARDLRLALLDASQKKISNPVDLLILYCCNYSPAAGRYSVNIIRILGIAGMFSLAAVIAMLFLLSRKPAVRAA